ncbi:putative permease domain protein [Bordetella holmesii 70147]|nr:putative permease domain protein [Bordetella holmesii 70147]
MGLFYMNLINLSRAWISSGKLPFGIGVWVIHAIVLALTIFLLYRRLRVKAPKPAKAA